ncbi:VWA domain-containing protein [Micromonospora sp. WMMD712]|uniref:vWA domain-containing protein n=1 Tax=Micromonospora sp. WMMD712 TaxID=3016096 RepID=UPI00249C951A|nr:VWA domain-containing protein [Micromonospora sp. WMMD712]WFE56931.1 VWA domain-containing protein [Micromonospora sp. WMMD712]
MTSAADPIMDLVGFAHRLRTDGLHVEVTRVATALRALGAFERLDPEDVYWATRLALCARHEDLPTFDAAFAAWFGNGPTTALGPALLPITAESGEPTDAPEDEGEDADIEGTTSRAGFAERLATVPPWTLSDSDRAEVASFVEAFIRAVPLHRTMRRATGGRRIVDVSRTARTMMRYAGEPAHLWYHRRLHARRRLVLLVDVSYSMRAYRALLLRFGYAAVAAAPTATEVFTIGTRLDRITRQLRSTDPQAAMHTLAARHSDWDGGTRLRATITDFSQVWGGHRMVRSANLVIISDGWELGDPAPLVAQVSRLSRLAHRVVWANPMAGEPGFTPSAPALLGSLPYAPLVATPDAAALRSLASLLGCPVCGPRCRRHRELRKWSAPT